MTAPEVEDPSDVGHSAFDMQGERSVIGCLLDDPDHVLPLVQDQISQAIFFDPLAKAALWAISEDLSAGIRPDIITVTNRLRSANRLEDIGGAHSVAELTDPLKRSHPHNLERDLGGLRDKAAQRWAMGARIVGATLDEISRDIEQKAAVIDEIRGGGEIAAAALGSLQAPTPEDRQTLLGKRYLCRGGGALLVGPTGVGKSSLSMQAATAWALGKPFFGIRPSGPLRSLIIQAENDPGDLWEMREGVFAGMGLDRKAREAAGRIIYCYQEEARSGEEFFARTVEPLLRLHTPDLLWIDPALSFIAGESNSQSDVGRFLRNWLNPLLKKYQCAGIVIHHTNKPPSGKEKSDWTGSDLAYLGSGSAEWANWARAVIAVRGLGTNDVFELCLGKRGGRVGWRNEAGEAVYTTLIAHAKEPGRIYWREADEDERPDGEKKTGRREVFSAEKLLKILGEGSKQFREWWAHAEAQQWSKATFKRRVAELMDDKRVVQSKLDGTYSRKILL